MNQETPVTPPENDLFSLGGQDPKKGQKMPLGMLIINVVLVLAVAALFILFFMKPKHTGTIINKDGTQAVTFAVVNTDSLWSTYFFVADVTSELSAYEKQLQGQYATTVKAFEKEYNDYLQAGTSGQLTLDQQKKKEEELAMKQQNLSLLDQQLTQQLMVKKEELNMEVHDTIVSYIQRYNKTRNYTFILEKSYGGGILYSVPELDITSEVLSALNEEYPAIKQRREAALNMPK